MKERRGSYAICSVCGRPKNPRGRSAPPEIAGLLCRPLFCPGYERPPYPGDLWPGESAADFGYPCQTTEERNR
jgi:hypothetical protein